VRGKDNKYIDFLFKKLIKLIRNKDSSTKSFSQFSIRTTGNTWPYDLGQISRSKYKCQRVCFGHDYFWIRLNITTPELWSHKIKQNLPKHPPPIQYPCVMRSFRQIHVHLDELHISNMFFIYTVYSLSFISENELGFLIFGSLN